MQQWHEFCSTGGGETGQAPCRGFLPPTNGTSVCSGMTVGCLLVHDVLVESAARLWPYSQYEPAATNDCSWLHPLVLCCTCLRVCLAADLGSSVPVASSVTHTGDCLASLCFECMLALQSICAQQCCPACMHAGVMSAPQGKAGCPEGAALALASGNALRSTRRHVSTAGSCSGHVFIKELALMVGTLHGACGIDGRHHREKVLHR
jgi:hypothetical protein